LLVTKQSLAESQRAAAVVLVNDASEVTEGDRLMNFADGRGSTPGKVPFVHMKRAVLEPMLRSGTGTGLLDVELAIDRDLRPRSSPLSGWTAAIETKVTQTMTPVKNVVGVREGAGPLANETIVIGAHYDHLGYGGPSSLARDKSKKQIHYGADDNA